MENIRVLRDAIRNAGYCITSFFFTFNSVDTIVIFEDAKVLKIGDDYTIAVLTFVRKDDISKRIEVFANTRRFIIKNPIEFLAFFNISDGSINPWDWSVIYESFERIVPDKYTNPVNHDELILRVSKLEERENPRNPNAFFCYDIRRLPVDTRTGKQMLRSVFIDNKTRLLYPELYNAVHAENDKTITFFYSAHKEDYKRREELLTNFTVRYGNGRF